MLKYLFLMFALFTSMTIFAGEGDDDSSIHDDQPRAERIL